MMTELFLAQFKRWIAEMREIAAYLNVPSPGCRPPGRADAYATCVEETGNHPPAGITCDYILLLRAGKRYREALMLARNLNASERGPAGGWNADLLAELGDTGHSQQLSQFEQPARRPPFPEASLPASAPRGSVYLPLRRRI